MAQTMNVKTGDNVVVITGKDAGKQGKVLASFPKKGRIIVEGVNIISRHTKPRSAKETGGIIKKEGTIDVSNVMMVCPECGKPTRVKHAMVEGKNVRVCKCGAVLDKKFEKVTKKKATTTKTKKSTSEATEAEPKTAKKTKVEKTTKTTKATSTKNKAETAKITRKQDM